MSKYKAEITKKLSYFHERGFCNAQKSAYQAGLTVAGKCGQSKTRRRSSVEGELDYFICVALDSKRFWVFPFGKLDQFTVKVYDSNSRFREYENAWELLEK